MSVHRFIEFFSSIFSKQRDFHPSPPSPEGNGKHQKALENSKLDTASRGVLLREVAGKGARGRADN